MALVAYGTVRVRDGDESRVFKDQEPLSGLSSDTRDHLKELGVAVEEEDHPNYEARPKKRAGRQRNKTQPAEDTPAGLGSDELPGDVDPPDPDAKP